MQYLERSGTGPLITRHEEAHKERERALHTFGVCVCFFFFLLVNTRRREKEKAAFVVWRIKR